MKFSVLTRDPSATASECVVVGVYQDQSADKSKRGSKPKSNPEARLTPTAQRIDAASGNRISGLLADRDLDGSVGSYQMLYQLDGVRAKRVLLVGLGKLGDFDASAARRVAAVAAQQLNARNIAESGVCLLEGEAENDKTSYRRRARNLVEAMEAALYRYTQTKSGDAAKSSTKLKQVTVFCAADDEKAVAEGLKQGNAVARAVAQVRDYANLPGNICTPSFLADEAKKMGKASGIKTTILSEAQMQKLGMNALLSVSRGSREPAKFIIMEYRNGAKDAAPVVLVGKGLTFDAGGISIKPSAAMDEMKYDMCGGASVLGALQAAAELELPLNLIGIVASSENLPDGAANKPGDVTSMSGTTIEILNTDAEGRLLLCDALTYAERYQPAAVVDIATLTGACMVALGNQASGLFSNAQELADELLAAGKASGDSAWQLPAWDEYDSQLKSNFADLANIGGRYAGAITAACFLKHFAKKFHWAHLDVAGTAWNSGADKGATGRPTPLLIEFLLNRSRS